MLLAVMCCMQLSCRQQAGKHSQQEKAVPAAGVVEKGLPVTGLPAKEEDGYRNDAEVWDILRKDYQGVWGDYFYLDMLRKYSSVAKARSFYLSSDYKHLLIELQVSEREILTDSPFGMEPYMLDKESYAVKIVDPETLLVKGKKTRGEQTLKKIPYDEELDGHFNESFFKYAMEKMQFAWFSGVYEMQDEDGLAIGTIQFDIHGKVDGYGNDMHYTFGYDSDNQDYILLEELNNWQHREYYLLEKNGICWYLYNVDEFDGFEEPFVKAELKYILKKIK